VLTHNPPERPLPGVTYVGDLPSAIAAAKDAAGDKYVNVLGANVGKQCLEAGELDEILTLVVPVLLGDGVRLFDWPGGRTFRLEHLSRSTADQATNLWYRVVYA
jgi:dihydrofolate reductase